MFATTRVLFVPSTFGRREHFPDPFSRAPPHPGTGTLLCRSDFLISQVGFARSHPSGGGRSLPTYSWSV
jgi:hypothetical protein